MENHVFLNILDKRTTKNNCHKINSSKDSGAVTAEFAIILPAVVVLALTLFFVGKSVVNTMNCHDAAGQVAYYVASHHNSKDAQNIVSKVSGVNSSVKVKYVGNMADIVVSCPVVPDPLKVLPLSVEARISQVLI